MGRLLSLTLAIVLFGLALTAAAAPVSAYGFVWAVKDNLGPECQQEPCPFWPDTCTDLGGVDCADPRDPEYYEHCDVWLPDNCF